MAVTRAGRCDAVASSVLCPRAMLWPSRSWRCARCGSAARRAMLRPHRFWRSLAMLWPSRFSVPVYHGAGRGRRRLLSTG